MKNKIVKIPSVKDPVKASPGFLKKELSDFKLDIVGLCGYGCRYCSSNSGNYLRINRKTFENYTVSQLGERVLPADAPELMFVWEDLLERLEAQLQRHSVTWGEGKTLVFSMLTDGFSPFLVGQGLTEDVLQLVLRKTSFRIRILTKNAVVGTARWISFFKAHPGRFVVGLSTGTMDENWARNVEVGTSSPLARLRALQKLQDAGVPTYGMLCPIFPDVLESGQLEKLLEMVRPDLVEHIWAEPFNDRFNWRIVRDAYPSNSLGYRWLNEVYDGGNKQEWSRYATDLYKRLRSHAEKTGWTGKLRYLLYEDQITQNDATVYRGLEGVLLQSKPDENGFSRNLHMASIQKEILDAERVSY